MKKKHIQKALIMLTLTFGFLSCKENEEVLPPITMEGNNSFGCYINGELWLPKGRGDGGLPIFVDRTVENFLAIGADNDNSGITLAIKDTTGIQTNRPYTLTSHPTSYCRYNIRKEKVSCDYRPEHVISGSMILTRLESNIVSGTFEFISYNPECGDTIKVTDGRFDLGSITR